MILGIGAGFCCRYRGKGVTWKPLSALSLVIGVQLALLVKDTRM